MNHKEFLNELQKACHLDHQQCATLLNALQKLMVQAAIDQIPITLDGLGTFVSHKHPEFIQEDPKTGKQTLFPPRISYRMQSIAPVPQMALPSLPSQLAEYSQSTIAQTDAFLKSMAEIISTHVHNHEVVEVHGLGSFQIIESHQVELQRIAFTPDEQMRGQVNAPFNCFDPIPISNIVENVSTEEKLDTATQDDATEIATNEVTAEPEKTDTSVVNTPVEPATSEIAVDLDKQEAQVAEDDSVDEQVVEEETPENENHAEAEKKAPAEEENPAIVATKVVESAPVVADIQTPKQTMPPVFQTMEEPARGRKNASNTLLYSAIAIIIVACIAFVLYMFTLGTGSKTEFTESVGQDKMEWSEDTDVAEDELLVSDEDAEAAEDEVLEEMEETDDPVEEASPSASAPAASSDPLHRMLGQDGNPVVVTLKAGDRLTFIAKDYYGDKAFWPYIYDVNSDKIKTPDNVAVGMKLYLPDPVFFGIDAKNPESVKKAINHGSEILRKK